MFFSSVHADDELKRYPRGDSKGHRVCEKHGFFGA